MKKFIVIFLLLTLAACTPLHYKGVATPEEVNNYLDKLAERSTIDPVSG